MLLSICLNFYQFQPGVAYKSVAYKKKRVPKIVEKHAHQNQATNTEINNNQYIRGGKRLRHVGKKILHNSGIMF